MRRTITAALLAAACALAPTRGRTSWTARVTYYVEIGYTASGQWTHDGGAACSYDLPFGTIVRFVETGLSVVCNDRGMLGSGSPTWVDIWAPSGWPQRVLGDWAEIEVQ